MSELAPVEVGTCDRQTTDLYQAANDAVFAREVQLADGSKQHAAQVNQADGGDTLTDASQFLDVSNFKTLLEDAQKPLSNEAAITTASQAAINTQVERLTEYAKQTPTMNSSPPTKRSSRQVPRQPHGPPVRETSASARSTRGR